MTINNASVEGTVISIHHNDPDIAIQGLVNNGTNVVEVSIPYTVTGSPKTLQAYSETFTIDAADTQDGTANIVATFRWTEKPNLPEGSGTFKATITTNGPYNAKKLPIDNLNIGNIDGKVVATFKYQMGGTSEGTATLRVLPVIRDRMYGIADKNGNTDTHKFVYLPVKSSTGKIWLNNNLGAEYADTTKNQDSFNPAQQATSSDDPKAYGSLFQWGRKADGHELINWTSATAGTGVNGAIGTQNDDPTDAFITQADWRVTTDDTLWAKDSNENNVCPVGYRLPVGGDDNLKGGEWEPEVDSWHTDNKHDDLTLAHAYESTLKLSKAGNRRSGGSMDDAGKAYYYSSGSVSSYNHEVIAVYIGKNSNDRIAGLLHFLEKGAGLSVRCIKDNN
jgi:uncharacterized protein (TIGR02145 family)